jgi:hypothetical protein
MADLEIGRARNDELNMFPDLAFEYIGKNYLDIDQSFIDNIIKSHREGFDIYGYFTLKKEIWVLRERGFVLGYLVATIKRGGSVKIGPQFMLHEYQQKGLGSEFRDMIETHLARRGFRKVYVTLPANAYHILEWDIGRGFRIEAHLKRHFNTAHDELVLGKSLHLKRMNPMNLNESIPENGKAIHKTRDRAYFELGCLDDRFNTQFKKMVMDLMPINYDQIDEQFAINICSATKRTEESFRKKGKVVTIAKINKKLLSSAVLTPKRGGACKISPLLIYPQYQRREVINELLIYSEEISQNILRCRRVYTILPLNETRVIGVFRDRGFLSEGILREPYRTKVDTIIMGKNYE